MAIPESLREVSKASLSTGQGRKAVKSAVDFAEHRFKLAGATGSLSLEGIEDLSDGTFVEDVTGEICLDLGR
jgi:hypothetical protein